MSACTSRRYPLPGRRFRGASSVPPIPAFQSGADLFGGVTCRSLRGGAFRPPFRQRSGGQFPIGMIQTVMEGTLLDVGGLGINGVEGVGGFAELSPEWFGDGGAFVVAGGDEGFGECVEFLLRWCARLFGRHSY